MLRVAYGAANWIIAPLTLGILMVSFGDDIGAPWLQQLAPVMLFVAFFFLYFFRDPDRAASTGISSPADGKVRAVDQVDDPDLGPCDRISIFMRVRDVHVNRFPFDGDVRSVEHRAGKHVPAFKKESDRNERVTTTMRTEHGDVKIIQIAGAVARRIVPYAAAGDHVAQGDKLGLIRLGSRCDVLVPAGNIRWTAEVGQRVWANRSKIGEVA